MKSFFPDSMAAACRGRWHPQPPVVAVESVCIDSRKAGPGSLFVALKGGKADGHDFLGAVAEAGACALIRDDFPVENLPASGHFLRVADPLSALGELSAAWRRRLPARLVGITGSVGKTSTKELAGDLLSTRGRTVRTRGNFNNEIGLPLSLLELDDSCVWGVLEAGISHPGEMAQLRDILRPDFAVMTRIAPVHIEFFESVRAIAEEKAALLEKLPADGFAVLDRDEPFFDLLKDHVSAPVVTCSLSGADADFSGERMPDGQLRVTEKQSGEQAVLPLPPPGAYMAENVLRSVALARRCGVTWAAAASALRANRPVGMRWAVEEVNGWTAINDGYNANPVSMRASLEAFREWPVSGRRFLVLGPMLELGAREAEDHEALGRFAAEGDWAGVAVVSVGHDAAAEAVCRGLENAGWPAEERILASNAVEAAAWLKGRLQDGDAVLLKASRGIRIEDVLNELKKD